MADLAHAVPLDSRSVIRIASQSKQFTVLLALILEAEGKLSLDDDVRRYLPWLPAYPRTVTLRHLASNTSGLRDILEMMILGGMPILAPSSRATARQIVARQHGLNFLPGEDLLYSNSNFLLLSEILEQVSGRSFNELLQERITGPLDMPDTRLMPRDDEILPRLATHHRRGPDGRWLKAAWGIAISGEGGLVSTLDDMVHWQQNLREPRVGTREMIAQMAAPGATINGVASPYGLGLVTTRHRGLTGIGHGGWIAGARSESVRFPEIDLGVIILTNIDEIAAFALARRIADAVLGQDTDPLLPPAAADRLAAVAGRYRDEQGDDLVAIECRDGEPMLVTSMGAAPIIDAGDALFMPQVSIPPFAFAVLDDGAIEVQRFGRRRRFRRLPATVAGKPNDPTGHYADPGSGLEAVILQQGAHWRMRLTSPFGAWEAALTWCDDDMLLAHPTVTEPHDAWRIAPWVLPWLFNVRLLPDAIVLNSDRTRHLRLNAAV
jgi:CubicO group peptidase (beta-lactamase class C family)